MRGTFAFIAVTSALLGACAQKAETAEPQEIIAAIQKAEEAQAAALGRNDIDAAYAVFAEDAVLYAPGMPPARGRAAIKAANERVLKDPAFNVRIDEASRKWWISDSGDLATTTYTTEWTHTDATSGKPVTQPLVSQTTWVRQSDGSWKNALDINAIYVAPSAPPN